MNRKTILSTRSRPFEASRSRLRLAFVVMSMLFAGTLWPMPVSAQTPITAQWVIDENARPGTSDWRIPTDAPQDLEGYADRVSVQQGEQVGIYVDTTAPTFHVEAYRLGWYGGKGGRSIWTSNELQGVDQPEPTMSTKTRMVEARWRRSLAITIDSDWVQGTYLLKLVSSTGGLAYVPLVVRDDASTARIVIQQAVMTWQAYNDWGGASLYSGPNEGFEDRAAVVSFDRPYYQTRGAGRMLSDLSLISLVESEGLDVTYWTDIDLHARPELLMHHQTLVTPSHDEYWSTAMRRGVTNARGRGVNLAFFGANDVYWHVRVEDSSRGEDRRIVCYKSKAQDPLRGVDDAEVSVRWRQKPVSKPESSLLGSMFGCSGVENEDFVVADASAWVFLGTSLRNGDTIPGVVNYEVDWVHPTKPTPENLQVLGHSPTRCGDDTTQVADMTYYTASSGSGVFNAASIGWLDGIRCAAPVKDSHCDLRARTMTLNVIKAFAEGPSGIAHPAVPNTASLGYDLTDPTTP